MKTHNGKPIAVSPIIGKETFELGIAVWQEQGYAPADKWGTYQTWDEAQKKADEINKSFDLTEEQAHLIIASSMFPKNTITMDLLKSKGQEAKQ